MPSLMFEEIKTCSGPTLAGRLIKSARKDAAKRGEYFPKKCGCGGMYGTMFYVDYNRNCVRDALLRAAKRLKLKEWSGLNLPND